MRTTNEHGHFLSEEQKKVKGDIMRALIDVMENAVRQHGALFDTQAFYDLIFSVLVMFNRDILTGLFLQTGIAHNRKEIMKTFFEAIKEEVNRKIRENMN